MIPERLAQTPGTQRIGEIIGSGPFKFRADLHRPGDRIVLDRNPSYVPRAEPADFMAGGKKSNVDTVELKVMPDGATAVAALQTGEIDYMQYVPFDLLVTLEKNRQVAVQGFEGLHTFQGYLRLNHAAKPFDDPAVRRVLWRLFDQETVLTALGLPDRYVVKGCRSFFMCKTPLETTAGGDIAVGASVEAARAALGATAYAGETIVVLQASDIDAPRVSSLVAADLLRRAGFKVDLQTTDWGTVLARRAKKEGWHLFGVHAFGFDLASPLTHFYIANNCNPDYAGWSCDRRLDPLFAAFVRASDLPARKQIAAQISTIAFENTPAVMWGQLAQPSAFRASLRGVIPSAIPVFWQVEK
jgi:peptide/nickel transport system substrate-binding protein